ncbi:flagellar basal body rod protein FlgB [Hydrogenimonas sp.]
MEISPAHELMARALDYRALRQDLISANIANVDTPYYRSRDISFEESLAEERARIDGRESKRLKLAVTDRDHFDAPAAGRGDRAKIFFRDGHMARNDGNTVDLDVETTEMAKNMTMYNALVAAMKKQGSIFRSVIDASAKV